LQAWYHSAAYQAILPPRLRNSISDTILVDAFPEGFTIRGFAEQIHDARRGA
jgi:hypothetical protein